MISENKFDVVVVGAGPGGATSAYELAKRGVQVALLEKESIPRDKLCGGGLTLKTTHLLPFDISPVVHQIIDSITIQYKGRDRLRISDGKLLMATTVRTEFDAFLTSQAERAGAKVFPHHILQEISASPNGYELTTNRGVFESRVIIGADGANSRVAKLQSLQRHPFAAIGIETDVQNDIGFPEDSITVNLGTIPHGYAWIFPKRTTLTIGAGGPAMLSKRIGQYLRDYTFEQTSHEPERKPRGHHLLIRKPGSPIQLNNVALVGDAASLVEPFTGEGIYYAIQSGQIVAEETANLLNGQTKNLENYERRVDTDIMPEIETGQLLSALVSRLPQLSIAILGASRDYQKFFCQVIRGEKRLSESAKQAGILEPLFILGRRLAIRDDRWNFLTPLDPTKTGR